MRLALALLTLAIDGGAVIPWDGRLEPGTTYVVIGENDPARGVDLIAETFRPPRLKLPHHHAGRVEWEGQVVLPRGTVRLVFRVESVDVQRMSENRWNSTWKCRVLSPSP